jgi:hypothetical protein
VGRYGGSIKGPAVLFEDARILVPNFVRQWSRLPLSDKTKKQRITPLFYL